MSELVSAERLALLRAQQSHRRNAPRSPVEAEAKPRPVEPSAAPELPALAREGVPAVLAGHAIAEEVWRETILPLAKARLIAGPHRPTAILYCQVCTIAAAAWQAVQSGDPERPIAIEWDTEGRNGRQIKRRPALEVFDRFVTRSLTLANELGATPMAWHRMDRGQLSLFDEAEA